MALTHALRALGLLDAPVHASPFVVTALRLLRPLATYTVVDDKTGGEFTSAMTELPLEEATRLYQNLTANGDSVSIGDDATLGPRGWGRTFKPPKLEGFAPLGTVGGYLAWPDVGTPVRWRKETRERRGKRYRHGTAHFSGVIARMERRGPDPDDIDLWAVPDGGGEEHRVYPASIQVPVEDLPRFRARAQRAHDQRMHELYGPISIPNDPPVDPAIYEASIKWGESEADATRKIDAICDVLKAAGFVDDRATAIKLYADGHSPERIRIWLKNDRDGVYARQQVLVRAPAGTHPIKTIAPVQSSAKEVTHELPDPEARGGECRLRGSGRPRRRDRR